MRRAASTPFMPGMWTSRNATCGPQVVEHLDRLAAVARLGHDLQLRPQARQVRGELLAQQRFVVGDQRGRRTRCVGGGGSDADVGAHTVRRLPGERDAGAGRKEHMQPLLQVAQPGAGARAFGQADTGVRDPQVDLFARAAPRSHLDVTAVASRVDAVADRVLDQRQQRHRRKAAACAADGSMASVNVSRSGMRISINSR